MRSEKSILWLYTPSNMDLETLEALFVGRDELAKSLEAEIDEFVSTIQPRHKLLLGARGIGKTHLMSIIHHRVREKYDEETLRIAWLNEDVSGVHDLLSLYRQILISAEGEERYSVLHKKLLEEGVANKSRLIDMMEAYIREHYTNRCLLVFSENFHAITHGFDSKSLWRFRSLLAECPGICLLLSAIKPIRHGKKPSDPLYGFFEQIALDELTADEALTLVKRIAELRQDTQLIKQLNSNRGGATIRAIHTILGGHQRIWAVFADLMKVENLNETIQLFQETIDRLTPYYQEKIWGNYSQQQQSVLAEIMKNSNWIQPTLIANRLLLPQNQISAILNELEEDRVIEKYREGRVAFYRLKDPLMALAGEVKESKGAPISLIIKFLVIWFNSQETRAERLDVYSQSTEKYMREVRRMQMQIHWANRWSANDFGMKWNYYLFDYALLKSLLIYKSYRSISFLESEDKQLKAICFLIDCLFQAEKSNWKSPSGPRVLSKMFSMTKPEIVKKIKKRVDGKFDQKMVIDFFEFLGELNPGLSLIAHAALDQMAYSSLTINIKNDPNSLCYLTFYRWARESVLAISKSAD